MAANQFIIRCQSGNGILTLRDISPLTTVGELKIHLSRCLHTEPQFIKILQGYPPQTLNEGTNNLTLASLNIQSGETLIIQKMPSLRGASDGSGDNVVQPAVVNPENILDVGGAGEGSGSDVVRPVVVDPQNIIDVGGAGEGSGSDVVRPVVVDPKSIIGVEGAGDHLTGIMMRHVVPSNNSCLFISVYFGISNGDLNPEKSNELRRIISQVVASNPVKFNHAVLQMSNQDYITWIMNTSHWGGAIELSILSEHFRIEIVAIDTSSLTVHRFGESFSFTNRIFLIYDGIHYDPLVLELQSGAFQTIFPVTDEYPLDMALELAKEARSSRRHTIVANFTLRCMQCDARLHSDVEARRHAGATGHVDFGEIDE